NLTSCRSMRQQSMSTFGLYILSMRRLELFKLVISFRLGKIKKMGSGEGHTVLARVMHGFVFNYFVSFFGACFAAFASAFSFAVHAFKSSCLFFLSAAVSPFGAVLNWAQGSAGF